MPSSREEQLRNNRRLARQLLGLVAMILILIGLFTVIGWCVTGLQALLDDSDRRQSYADRLYGLVMFDTLPFEDVSQVDQSVFKQAAIWGCVLSDPGRRRKAWMTTSANEETGSVILPRAGGGHLPDHTCWAPTTWWRKAPSRPAR